MKFQIDLDLIKIKTIFTYLGDFKFNKSSDFFMIFNSGSTDKKTNLTNPERCRRTGTQKAWKKCGRKGLKTSTSRREGHPVN